MPVGLYVFDCALLKPSALSSIMPRRFAHASSQSPVCAGTMVIGDDVDIRTLKFCPLPSPSPATFMLKVDHFPSSPSYVPEGLKTKGLGGSGIVSALFVQTIFGVDCTLRSS